MSRISKTIIAGALAIAPTFGVATASEATDTQCTCSSATQGVLTSVAGDVTLSGETGFIVGEAGASLSKGAQVHTGEDGIAVISFGSGCDISIGGHSKATIVDDANSANLCAKVTKNELFADEGELTINQAQAVGAGIGGTVSTPAIITTVVIGGAIAAVAVEAGKDDEVPVSP